MDFNLTREQALIQKTLREFTEAEVKPIAAETDRTSEYPKDTIDQLFRYGVMGMCVPTQYGGAGADDVSAAIAVEELSKQCASTGDIVATHNGLCCGPIINFGTEEQKKKYLGMLCNGKVGAFALTEPNAGSDASKGTKGISAFIVEKDFPGFSVGRHEEKLGLHGSPTSEIVFEDCIIPKENLLGKLGKGFNIAMNTLDGGRIGIAAQALGIAEGAMNQAVEYTKGRVQFGRPIAKFQNTQFKFADMEVSINAARLLTYAAAAAKSEGKRFTKDAAMAKLFASEAAMKYTTKAVQLHGGYGYTNDYPVERMMRDAKITELYEGTSEIQRVVISGNVLGK